MFSNFCGSNSGNNTLRDWVNFRFATIRFVYYYNSSGTHFLDVPSILNANDNIYSTNISFPLLHSTVSLLKKSWHNIFDK